MNDQDRLRVEYARRAQDPRYQEWYADSNIANRFIEQDRDAARRAALKPFPHVLTPNARVLDVGCGAGHELWKWREWTAEKNLCGVDLLETRLRRGQDLFPSLPLSCADASALPFPDGAFDVVMQFTVFSSILDAALRQHVAREMARVLKPRGVVLWYDYWFNPTNAQTRGVTRREIRKLFPQFAMHSARVTLAPPLARFVAPRSLQWCARLNRIPFLRSHYLIVLFRP
jgi:ubiquinone/menaquinone biosynthesis C-methylase UbiE